MNRLTRIKCRCTEVTVTPGGTKSTFEPVTHGSPENDSFFHYTPYGKLEFGLIDTNAHGKGFIPGWEYYFDITVAANAEGVPIISDNSMIDNAVEGVPQDKESVGAEDAPVPTN